MATILDYLRLFEDGGHFLRAVYVRLAKAMPIRPGEPLPLALTGSAYAETPRISRGFSVNAAAPAFSYGRASGALPRFISAAVLPQLITDGAAPRRNGDDQFISAGRAARLDIQRARDALAGHAVQYSRRLAAAAVERLMPEEEGQTRRAVFAPQSQSPARTVPGADYPFSMTADARPGEWAKTPLRDRYILTEKGESLYTPGGAQAPIPAAHPVPIDYDAIYRHVERRLGEAVVCTKEGF